MTGPNPSPSVPRVSVIMPAYNVAEFIGIAIDSVLAQTFSDLELIVVDDGSTDETASIVQQRQAADGRGLVHLIRQSNQGLAAARNAALAVAKGECFALLDSDDLWEPSFLASQMSVLDRDAGVAIVTGNARYIGGPEHGAPVRPHPDPRPDPNLRTILGDERAVFIMSVFRRSVFDRIGGFKPKFRTNEDYDFWLRAASAGFRFVRNSAPLAGYRIRAESLSADEVRMLRGILAVYADARPMLPVGSIERSTLDRQVRRFQAELFAALARSGARPEPVLRHGEFVSALFAMRDRKTRVAAALARYSPQMFHHVRTVRRRLGDPANSPVLPTETGVTNSAAGTDRAGKDYWDGVWQHTDFPADIDPQSRSIWAHRDQEFHRFFQEQLGAAPHGLSVLELGCARSAWLPYFAREFGCRISGLDYSEYGAAQAAERLKQLGIPHDIRCANLFEPPPDWVGAFDVVVWFGVAEHFEDTTGVINAASAYLKPGGLLVTEIPNMVGFTGWLQKWLNKPVFDIHVPLGCPELRRHHAAAGLQVTGARYLVPTDFGVVNLENLPAGLSRRVKDRLLYALRLLSGCIWWVDRRVGPLSPGRLTSGFVIVAARKPAAVFS